MCCSRESGKVSRSPGFNLGQLAASRCGPRRSPGRRSFSRRPTARRRWWSRRAASTVLVGAPSNFTALADRARALFATQGKDLLFLCSGRERQFAIEDAYTAGRLVKAVRRGIRGIELNDAATVALALTGIYKTWVDAFAASAAPRANSHEVDLDADVEFCREGRPLRHRPAPTRTAASRDGPRAPRARGCWRPRSRRVPRAHAPRRRGTSRETSGRALGSGLWEAVGTGALLLPVLGIGWALAAFGRLGSLSSPRAAILGSGLIVLLVPYGIAIAVGLRLEDLSPSYAVWTSGARLVGSSCPPSSPPWSSAPIGPAGAGQIGLFALSALGVFTVGLAPPRGPACASGTRRPRPASARSRSARRPTPPTRPKRTSSLRFQGRPLPAPPPRRSRKPKPEPPSPKPASPPLPPPEGCSSPRSIS